MSENLFLVRHGKYNHKSLTPEGEEQARQAADELTNLCLGKDALILTSTANRAVDTSVIIAEILGTTQIVPSVRIEKGGDWLVTGVKNLDDWITKAFEESRTIPDPDSRLIVVTHAPMLAIAKGIGTANVDRINYGEVVEYTPGTWNNREYADPWAEVAEEEIAAALAANPAPRI